MLTKSFRGIEQMMIRVDEFSCFRTVRFLKKKTDADTVLRSMIEE